jgi:hypothetical protein
MGGENYTPDTVTCERCNETELVYRIQTENKVVNQCLTCLAVNQGKQQLDLPFETYIQQETGDVMEDLGINDRRELQYESAHEWFIVLKRIQQDNPILHQDTPNTDTDTDTDTRSETITCIREYLIEIMGEAAYYPPSRIITSNGDPAQKTLQEIMP